jgi:hypothetical protein
MNTQPCVAIIRPARCAAMVMTILLLAACGGGDSSGGQAPATLTVASADSNAAIKSGASLSGLSKMSISRTGTDASGISATFTAASDAPQPLVPDLASPGQFWLPLVLTRTAGTLSIAVANRAPVAMQLILTPFAAPDAPGVATRNFLQECLSNSTAALKDMLAGQPLPVLLQALNSAMQLTQQELAWVTNVMQNGAATIATRKDGTMVNMTTDDLKALDQMVLHTEASRTNQGAAPPAARLSPWRKIVDFLMPSAYAQTSDSAAFISGTKATGDALGLTANMVAGVAVAGTAAFRQNADAHVVSLNMAGLYAAHYGNALATIQTLPNLTFAEPVDNVQIAVSALFAGVINEIVLPDLNDLAQDTAVGLVRKFTANVDNAAVENIVMNQVFIFKTRSVGINLCPAGEHAVADADSGFVRCAGL